MRYIHTHVEYPRVDEVLLTGPRVGVMYQYVPSLWLDVLLFYSQPVKAWLLERYRAHDPAMLGLPDKEFHLNLHDVDDDVVILARLRDSECAYFLMWYDCDVSDCQFMFFMANESVDEIATEVRKWLDGQCRPELAGKERDDPPGSGSGWETLSRVFDFPIDRVKGSVGTH
jgi:hypothetical protein